MPDTLAPVVNVTTATGFVVVSRWRPRVGPGPLEYEYKHVATAEEAERELYDYENGEYPRAEAVGIFAVRNGLPFGPALVEGRGGFTAPGL